MQNGSHLYGDILSAVHRDVAASGPCADIFDPYASAPFADAVVLRFLGGVHRLVLEGRAPQLAAHYPSVGGVPHRDVGATFVAVVDAHRDELERRMHDGVQTNEVGRSAALLGGFLAAAAAGDGLALRVLEVGASAGLNLRFDAYRYESGGESFGPEDSPVRFVEPWAGGATARVEAGGGRGGRASPLPGWCTVAERRGCDVAAIDPSSEDGRLALRSYIWPDQVTRLDRLDAALAVARTLAAPVDRADATTWLEQRLAEPVTGLTTVVVHSIMFQYLSPDGRRGLLQTIEGAGRHATADAPLVWLRMEPGGEFAEIRITTWPDGATRLLATSSYHGPPVRWMGDRDLRPAPVGTD